MEKHSKFNLENTIVCQLFVSTRCTNAVKNRPLSVPSKKFEMKTGSGTFDLNKPKRVRLCPLLIKTSKLFWHFNGFVIDFSFQFWTNSADFGKYLNQARKLKSAPNQNNSPGNIWERMKKREKANTNAVVVAIGVTQFWSWRKHSEIYSQFGLSWEFSREFFSCGHSIHSVE